MSTTNTSTMDISISITIRYTVPPNYRVDDVLNYLRTAQWINDISKHIVPYLKSRTDPAFIAQLPSAAQRLSNQEECVICMRVMEESAVELPCGHPFHVSCISTWLSIRNTCPSCVAVVGSQFNGRYAFRQVATKLLLHDLDGEDGVDILQVDVSGQVLKAIVDVVLSQAGPPSVDGETKTPCEMKSGYTTAQADRTDDETKSSS